MTHSKLVAILNITPNSFSDGGLFLDPQNAKNQLDHLLESNPAVIDIGAISTRPNSMQPSVQEEIARYEQILPAIAPILKNTPAKISIDSYNYETIEYLSKHIPINWINDQKGFIDERLIELAKKINSKIVIMHHLTIPADPGVCLDLKLDATEEVKSWLLNKARYLISKGIDPNNIILDPGIGFGKTAEQSWQLIREAEKFTKLGFAVMFGHSRKSFFNLITDKDFIERDLETSIITYFLVQKNIDYIRVHNITDNLQAIKILEHLEHKNG